MVESPQTHPFEIFVGSLKTMEQIAESGVRGWNHRAHRWQLVTTTATYLVVKDFEVSDDETGEKHWCASLFCDEDLRAVAKEKDLSLH